MKVVQPIVDRHEIHRLVPERQVLHVRNDRLDPQVVPIRPGLRPSGRAERQVRAGVRCTGAGEELRVHSRSTADSKRRSADEMRTDRRHWSAKLLVEHEPVETGCPVRPRDLELLGHRPVEMLRLRRLVSVTSASVIMGGVNVVDLVLLGQHAAGKENRDAVYDGMRPTTRGAGVGVYLGAQGSPAERADECRSPGTRGGYHRLMIGRAEPSMAQCRPIAMTRASASNA